MRYSLIGGAFALLTMCATVASAGTIGFTEGTRDLVAGTTRVSPNQDSSSNPAGAFDMGAVDGSTTIEVYGRIVGAVDNLAFAFSTVGEFAVSFIFDGYDLDGGGTVTDSGFVSEGTAEKTATFRLLEDTGAGFVEAASEIFTTDVTSGNPLLFTGGAGDWVIQVDGRPRNSPGVGLYDLRVSQVPLPASALFLIAGLGGLGVASRRRRS